VPPAIGNKQLAVRTGPVSLDVLAKQLHQWAAELGLSGPDAVGKISYYGTDLLFDTD